VKGRELTQVEGRYQHALFADQIATAVAEKAPQNGKEGGILNFYVEQYAVLVGERLRYFLQKRYVVPVPDIHRPESGKQ